MMTQDRVRAYRTAYSTTMNADADALTRLMQGALLTELGQLDEALPLLESVESFAKVRLS